MRGKYSTGLLAFLAAAAAALPCPPQLADTARRVAALRGVEGGLAPPCRWIGPEALRRELDLKLRRDLPLAPETFLEVLTRLGLAHGRPEALYQRLLDFYASQVLGFYEPDDDSMVLVSGPAAATVQAESVWAHELAHAAQQHRFGLPARLLAMRDDGDAQRAASAIAEGEAMLVMFLLAGEADEAGLAHAERLLAAQATATATPPGLPEYFVADLVFPYTAGFSAVLRAYRTGGWPAVDALLLRPPASTAALLHPAEPPPGPPLGDGALPGAPAGWTSVLTETMGEWALGFLLGRRLPAGEASRLASTWNGDRLRLVRRASHPQRWALAWELRCRAEGPCVALGRALQDALPVLLSELPGPGGRLALDVVTDGTSIAVRAGWPGAGAGR